MATATSELLGFSVFPGSVLSGVNLRVAGQESETDLPPAVLLAGGVGFDGDEAQPQYLVEFRNASDAEAAVPVIADRIVNDHSAVTGQPYKEILGKATVDQLEDSSIVRVLCAEPLMAQRWESLIVRSDLGFLTTI